MATGAAEANGATSARARRWEPHPALGENRDMPTSPLARRPEPSEYAPFYANYVAAVPDGDIVETVEREGGRIVELLRALPEASADHAYAPGKWRVREVVAHVADGERVFAYRLLRFGRGDRTPLASFDQDLWIGNCHARTRPWPALIDDLEAARASTLGVLRSLAPEDFDRDGEASGARVTVRALAWIVAGHELHHRRVLTERYGLFGG
ncbi:MAG: DNA damage-inducible protein DinB [Acidobacteriota bacterium]